MKEDKNEQERFVLKENTKTYRLMKLLNMFKVIEEQPEVPFIITLRAWIPTSKIGIDQKYKFFLKKDENGLSWFFKRLARGKLDYRVAEVYIDDEAYLWNDRWRNDDEEKKDE